MLTSPIQDGQVYTSEGRSGAHKVCPRGPYLTLNILRPRQNGSHNAMVADDLAMLGARAPRLNIKTVLSTYGDFHVKDKTAARTSYL